MDTLRRLSTVRFAVGAASLLVPNTAGRLFGLDPARNPQAVYFARLFGIRDIALAVGALQCTGDTRRQWTQLGLMCDVSDTFAALLGRRDGSLSPLTTVLAGATAAGAAALGAKALQEAPSSSA